MQSVTRSDDGSPQGQPGGGAPAPTSAAILSSDYCEAWTQYSEGESAFFDEFEDPESEPEYRKFVGQALREFADIAPLAVRADWEYFRDLYERDAEQFLTTIDDPEADARAESIFTHLESACGIDILGG